MFVVKLPDEIAFKYTMILNEFERHYWFMSNEIKQIVGYTIPLYSGVSDSYKDQTLDGYMIITERRKEFAIETFLDRWVLDSTKAIQTIISGKRLTITQEGILYEC